MALGYKLAVVGAPIPVALLLATWLRADWLLERNKLRTWLLPALALLIPTIVLLTVVPLYRVYRIPEVRPGFSIDEFVRPLTPEEQATRDLFKQAEETIGQSALIKKEAENNEAIRENADEEKETVYTDSSIPEPLTAEQIAWVELNRKAITLLIEASKGPRRICSYSSINGYPSVFNVGATDLLIHSAMMLESDGHLDEALDRYLAAIRISRQLENVFLEHQVYNRLPFWATRPRQTPQRVKNALQQLEKLTADAQLEDRDIKVQYMQFRKVFTNGFDAQIEKYSLLTFLWQHLPWERARAMRLLNLLTRDDLEAVHKAEIDLNEDKPINDPPGMYRWENEWETWTSDPEYAFRDVIHIPPLRYAKFSRYLIHRYAILENHRRATLILLAIQAHRLEHGAYPKTLDDLAGTYFEECPSTHIPANHTGIIPKD